VTLFSVPSSGTWCRVVWYKCWAFRNHIFSAIIMLTLQRRPFVSPSGCKNCVAIINYDSGCRGDWSRMIFPTDQQFLIQITSAPPKAKIASGPARLHVQDQRFCITTGVPPRLIGFWEIGQLRWVSAAGISGYFGALESTGQHMSLEVSEMELKCEPMGT